MDESYDMNGTLIQIGDTVDWYENGEVEYTFTVELIGRDDIWGSDIPVDPYCIYYDDERYGQTDYDSLNWHTSTYSKVVIKKSKTKWEGSTIKFNFI